MNIYCSALPNDQDMIKALGSTAVPIPVPHGDCVFWGAADNDEIIRICVERKKIGDISACILDGRYMSQAQAAKDAGMDTLILIVEGAMRPSPEDGLVEVPIWQIDAKTLRRKQFWEPVKPAITYSRFDQYLTELSYLAGIIVKRSRDVQETASQIKALWVNFQTPPSKHNSMHQIFVAPMGIVPLTRPSLIRRVAKELDGIGWGRSGDVAGKFPSVKAMVDATEKDWMSIPGVGRLIARKTVNSLNGLPNGT